MRPELNDIQIIEKFILGELSQENEQKVLEKIENDPEFAKKVEKQRLIVEANKNLGLKQTAKKSKSKFKLKKLLKVGLPVVAALAAAGYLYTANVTGSESDWSSENVKYEVNENGEALWSEADVQIKPQFFKVNADQDNLLTGEDGTKIAIPKGALVDANGNPVTGPVEIELKEAIKAEDIIKGGLSTMSGDDLLETGGMVYFNARKDGENLKIDPAKQIAIDVPTDEVKEGMMLYDGVRQKDGAIDWQNPKELNRDLTTVDIHSLDFYPAGYEAHVEKLGHQNKSKAWLDSLYYSFAGFSTGYQDVAVSSYYVAGGRMTNEEARILGIDPNSATGNLSMESLSAQQLIKLGYAYMDTVVFDEGVDYQIDPSKIKAIWSDEFQNTYIATKEFEERLKVIFSSCKEEYLSLYVRNIEHDLYFTDSIIVKENCSAMNFDTPVNEEVRVRHILIRQNNVNGKKLADSVKSELVNHGNFKELSQLTADVDANGDANNEGVYDWFRRGTMVPEFEEYCFSHVVGSIGVVETQFGFHVVEILGKREAAPEGKGSFAELIFDPVDVDICNQFKKFAAQKLGGVKVSSESVKVLNNYYKNVAAAQQQAAKKVQDKLWSEYQDGVKEINNIESQEVERIADNYQKMYYEELNFNIKEVSAQLGIPADTELPADEFRKRGYVGTIASPGWLNVDRQIRESLDNRTSVDVTLDGKNAKIAYEEMTVEVSNEANFDRVLTYLLPKELTSYQRVTKRDGAKFTETLNEFMEYDLLVVGFKGEEVSLVLEEGVSPKAYELSLKPSSMDRLNALMTESGKGMDARKNLTSSIKNKIRQKVLTDKMKPYKEMQRFRNELAGTLFPCYDFPLQDIEDDTATAY